MIPEAPSEVQAEIDVALAEKARDLEIQAPFVQLGPGGDYARPIDLGRPWSIGRRLRSWRRRLFGRRKAT